MGKAPEAWDDSGTAHGVASDPDVQEWKTLSVPRGKSEEFNRKMEEKRRQADAVSGKDSVASR